LARTEEPTLWLANEPPRALAGPGSALTGEVKPGPTNQLPEQPSQPEAVSSELPPVWKGINKVEAKSYPDADGVILRQRMSCTLGSNPAFIREQEEFVQILAVEGKRLGDFDISYSPPEEEVEFLDCEVLGPDGKLSRLAQNSVNEGHEQKVGDYRGPRRKFFSLPAVAPGAVLHVRYRTQWKKFPLPQISMELPLIQELPALDSNVQITVPRETPFHFAFEEVAAPDPSIQQTAYGTTYSWHFDRLRSSEPEVLTAPRHGGRLLFSTWVDWAAFAEWYARISHLTDVVTPELKAKAEALTKAATDERSKLVALFNYVTALRYVAIPLGVNSFRPHAAANVLQNQFGDCKDKANLLNALLRSLAIPADLVLVPRFSQAHESIPGLSFNHAISRVALGDETLWLDTTDEICRFGLLPPGDPGRKVLVIDGHTAALTQLPTPEPKDHSLTLRGRVEGSTAEGGWTASLKTVARGYPDYELRQAARETRARRGSVPLLSARFRPVAGSFALEKQNATAVSALAEDFAWEADGAHVGLAAAADGRLLLRAPVWLPKEWDQALHARHSPLFLNQGYPLTLEQDFEVMLPAMSTSAPDTPKGEPPTLRAALPQACESAQEPLRWRLEWVKISDVKLAVRFRAELARGELSAAETPVFQQQLRALLSALGATAVLDLPPPISKL
jgi:hypothetical protein